MVTLEQTLRQDADSVLSTALDATAVPSGARSILMAAACLFARKGYGTTSVRTIASAADVTVPMVYYYFDGKEQIFVTLFDCLRRDLLTRLQAVSDQEGLSFREELVQVVHVFRSLLYPCPVVLQLITQFVFGPRESRPQSRIDSQINEMTTHFRTMFEAAAANGEFEPTPGFSLGEVSRYFVNVVRSHMMHVMKRLERPDVDRESIYSEFLTDQALERLVDIFLNGAGEVSSPA